MIRPFLRPTAPFKIQATLFLLILSVELIVGPPAVKHVKLNQTVPNHPDNHEKPEDDMATRHDLEYNRYLKEVVDVLESDPEFRKKLETAEEVDFRNGKIASELEYLNHQVRTKLDEVKRSELSRLRELLKESEERKKAHNLSSHGHLDHSNPHTFEVQDLQMLMDKVRKDLTAADELRKKEFKEYEMQKEFEKEQKLNSMDEEHRKAYLNELEESKKKAHKHDPVHHPGSKAQLEEVWEKADQMMQKFDPKTFFYLHDLDGNGYWDEQEVNALFLKELDKIYALATNNSHVDMREREEEMERMREHVFTESDLNRDRFISLDEFLDQTQKSEWQKDDGWESIDQHPQFTQEEFHEFERQRQAEIEELVRQGAIPPQPPYQYAHPGQAPHYQPVHGPGMPVNQAHYPQYQAHPAASNEHHQQPPGSAPQQYQHHPAAAQQQYQHHPAAAQQQYQHHPAPAQQQYQHQPAAAQQQYQHQPVAAQQQHQQYPPAHHVQQQNAISQGHANDGEQYRQQPPQYNQHPNDVTQTGAHQAAPVMNQAGGHQGAHPGVESVHSQQQPENHARDTHIPPMHPPTTGNDTYEAAAPHANQVPEEVHHQGQQPVIPDHPEANEIHSN